MQLRKIKLRLYSDSIQYLQFAIIYKSVKMLCILLSPVEVRPLDHTNFFGQQDLDSKKSENRIHK